jgi:hypothetical protein
VKEVAEEEEEQINLKLYYSNLAAKRSTVLHSSKGDAK